MVKAQEVHTEAHPLERLFTFLMVEPVGKTSLGVQKLSFPSLRPDGTRLNIWGNTWEKNSGVEISIDSPTDALPLVTALSLAPSTEGSRFSVFTANLIDDGQIFAPVWANSRNDRKVAREILLDQNSLQVEEQVLDQLATMVDGFVDDRAVALMNGDDANNPSNWVGLKHGEYCGMKGLNITTDLIAFGSVTHSGNTESMAIIQRGNKSDELTLTHSAWNVLLTDATVRHLPDDTTINVPLAVVEHSKSSTSVHRMVEMKVKDLRSLSEKILRVMSRNNYLKEGFQFWPLELAVLYSLINPYPLNSELSIVRPPLSIPDIPNSSRLSSHVMSSYRPQVVSPRPLTVPVKSVDTKSVFREVAKLNQVKKEIVTPPPRPFNDIRIEPVVKGSPTSEAKSTTSEVMPKDLRRRLIDMSSGNFTELVSQERVAVELESLMAQFANVMGDLKVGVTPNDMGQGWRVRGSNAKQSFAMSLVPDKISGFIVTDIELSGFGLKGIAIKALLNPDLILSQLNKNLPKYLPGINISKLHIVCVGMGRYRGLLRKFVMVIFF